MVKSNIITEKLEELIELAKIEGDVNTEIILLGLCGARYSGDDHLLASKVQEYIKDVLLPNARANEERQIASNN